MKKIGLNKIKFNLGKQRRTFFILVVVLLLFAVIYRVFPLIQGFWGSEEDLILKKRQLGKYQRAVTEASDLDSKLMALKKVMGLAESGLLQGKTPSLAAADIQRILHGLASQGGVEIKSVRVLKPEVEEQEDYLSIPVQLTIHSTIRELKEILYRIETSPKYLTVKKLRIRLGSRRKPGEIRSDITIHGFLKKAET